MDQQDLAEITSDDFPGERLIACRNPVLAAERARKREDLLQATEKLLAPLMARAFRRRAAGRGRGRSAWQMGKVISKYKTGKHFALTITDTSLAVTRRARRRWERKPPWTGSTCCAPPSPPATWTAPGVVPAYKNLKYARQGTSGTSNPMTWTCARYSARHGQRVRSHVLICMLACYLTWHLHRHTSALLTLTDENPPAPEQPRRPRPPLTPRAGQGVMPA